MRKSVLLTILVLSLFTLSLSTASIEAAQQAWAKWHRPIERAGIIEQKTNATPHF